MNAPSSRVISHAQNLCVFNNFHLIGLAFDQIENLGVSHGREKIQGERERERVHRSNVFQFDTQYECIPKRSLRADLTISIVQKVRIF